MGFWTICCCGLLDHLTNKLHSFSFLSKEKNRAFKHRAIAKAMTTLRRFCCNDLLRFTSVNLDHLTETVFFSISIPLLLISKWIFSVFQFPLNSVLMQSSSPPFFFFFFLQFNMSFYMTYLARWPDYFHVAEAPGNRIMGYSECHCSLIPLSHCLFVCLNGLELCF